MSLGIIVLIGGMAVVALTGIGFLVLGLATGQFKNVEEAKYKMLEEDEPQPWPHQKGDQS
ncbi:MAG: cbb3-type cytochrome oxidase assembly protein CcoS [Anaerolineales bacterium]|jgi:hypothetical protein